MREWVRKAVMDRLNAVHMHVDAKTVIDGLTEEEAQKVPYEGGRSPKEFLHHIVFWQDYVWEVLKGNVPESGEGMDWDVGSKTYESLIERFNEGLSGLLSIAENADLDGKIKVTEKYTARVGAELLGISQHTSYHLGQLVTTRKALGKWSKD